MNTSATHYICGDSCFQKFKMHLTPFTTFECLKTQFVLNLVPPPKKLGMVNIKPGGRLSQEVEMNRNTLAVITGKPTVQYHALK